MRTRTSPLNTVVVLAVAWVVNSIPHAAHATLANGENAIDGLGQFDIDNATVLYTKNGHNNGPNQLGFNGPRALALDTVHHRLFVSDLTNDRVLVYNLDSSNNLTTRVPANVIGQADFNSNAYGTSQSTLRAQIGVAYDSTNDRLFVADQQNSRVLVFNTSTITNGMNASYELGQPSGANAFTTLGTSVSQSGLTHPCAVSYDASNNRLFVADQGSNRVLVYNVAPATIANGENASYVLGQADFVSSATSTTQSSLSSPNAVTYDPVDNWVFVSDGSNSRIMVFDATPGTIANGENALYELGQSSGATAFTTSATATTQSGFLGVEGTAYDATNHRLFVGDTTNGRVLVFNVASGTIANGENASYVLGHSNFTTTNGNVGQNRLNTSRALAYDAGNTRLYVADYGNNRVEIFNVATGSITNGENASDGLGQFDIDNATVLYSKADPNNGPNQLGFNQPAGLAVDAINHRLFVADSQNFRILVYNLNTDNSFATRVPANVLGPTNFVSKTGGHTQSLLNVPNCLTFDAVNNRLFVADQGSNRVLVYNTSSITNGMNASYELGQPSGVNAFTTLAATTTQSGLNSPRAMAYDPTDNWLFVADFQNNRTMVFDVAPGNISNGENALYELGQPSGGTAFTSSATATTQSGMNGPFGVAYDSTNARLFVGDQNNSRVLAFNVAPGTISNGENASFELGQPSGVNAFTTSFGSTSQSQMHTVRELSYDTYNNRLFVGDNGNSRIMVFNVAPSQITSGMNASFEVGQPGGSNAFTTSAAATTQSGLNNVRTPLFDPATGHLFAVDYGADRIMIFDATNMPAWTPGYD